MYNSFATCIPICITISILFLIFSFDYFFCLYFYFIFILILYTILLFKVMEKLPHLQKFQFKLGSTTLCCQSEI